MKQTLLFLISTAFFFGTSTTSIASDWSVSGNIAITSDYVFRGFTQTDAGPALQGGIDVNHRKGYFIGAWGSNVDSDYFDNANMELDIYLGWNGKLGGSGLELTAKALRMNYPGTNTNTNNTNEFSVYLGYDFGPISVSGGSNYSDDSYGLGKAWYWDGGVNIPAGPTTISLHAGRSDFDAGGDYTDYSIGVSGEVSGIGLSLTYSGTEGIDGGCVARTCDERVIFTISKFFSN